MHSNDIFLSVKNLVSFPKSKGYLFHVVHRLSLSPRKIFHPSLGVQYKSVAYTKPESVSIVLSSRKDADRASKLSHLHKDRICKLTIAL